MRPEAKYQKEKKMKKKAKPVSINHSPEGEPAPSFIGILFKY